MKKTTHILLMLAAFGLLLSCVKERFPSDSGRTGYTAGDVPVTVRAVLPEGWLPFGTRALSDITQIDSAELSTRGFGVYAFYTGTESWSASKDSSAYRDFGLVMNNRKFEYSASAWHNTGKAEFWPATSGENLSLFAYAPWDTWHTEASYDGRQAKIRSDDFVAQSLSVAELEKQRDLLWGVNSSGDPHRDVEKIDFNPEGTVDFHFRHATAKVSLSVQGSLAGEIRNMTNSGNTNTTTGTAGATIQGETTSGVGDPHFNVANTSTYYRSGGGNWYYGYTRYYHATQTQTETESRTEVQYRTNTVTNTNARYEVSGNRYLVERVTMKGFYKTGSLLLANTDAYVPSWTDTTRFTGTDPEYVLTSSNVLSPSLRYVNAATVQSNFSNYIGITDTPSDLMSGYFLYAIPRPSKAGDRIALTIDYHKLNVSGNLTVNQRRQVVQKRTRVSTRTRERSRNSEEITVTSDWDTNNSWTSAFNSNASTEDKYTFTAEFGNWSNWSAWNTPAWGNWADDSYGEWEITSENLTGAHVNYNDDTSPHLSGEVITSFQGGRAYVINLIVAGDKLDLDVVPRPWNLNDFLFDYNAETNSVDQALTYDSSFIDYANNGDVFINNRMGKFFFRLGSGRFSSWQASLVPSAGSPGAFGFTDENGNWITESDGVTKVSSIRGAIDPSVTNFIYVKATNPESTVLSSAKLRIYLIDATGDATVALNLVSQQSVTEWNIVQNAN